MGRDASGIPNTCPTIDDAIYLMNKVRDANSELRDFGNRMYEEKEDALEKINELEKQIEELKSEISDYEKRIAELETSVN